MAVTVSGERVLAMDAVRINHLQAYKMRYLEFPAVLVGTRWISALDDQKTCTQNPKKVWTFTEDVKAGHVCKRQSSEMPRTYNCQADALFGRTSKHVYKVAFGDTSLPDWALERPHITLKRDGKEKSIGLQMCESSI